MLLHSALGGGGFSVPLWFSPYVLLRSSEIDSKELIITQVYVAWRAGTITLFKLRS
jgi:hypothetical protein